MRALTFLLAVVLCSPALLSAQVINLKPSIGLASPPTGSDAVCPITTVKNSFDNSGYDRGESAADFTLYTPEGQPVNLRAELSKGKPVLLVAGSYTCPVYRRQMKQLNAIYDRYRDSICIYIVYTVEAHPITDPSPYSGKEWVTSDNEKEQILYRQPTTYGERMAIVSDMLSEMNIKPQVLLDGPCNEWWLNYGPAPNNAHLIDVDGSVAARHGWFNRAPHDMTSPIDSLLGSSTGGGGGTSGTFEIVQADPLRVVGSPFTTLSAMVVLRNSSESAVLVDMIRTVNDVRNGWASAMCADICLATYQDSSSIYLYPGAEQSFTMYFYATEADSAYAEVLFRNADDPQNSITVRFTGVAVPSANVLNGPKQHQQKRVTYRSGNLDIATHDLSATTTLQLVDITGRIVSEETIEAQQALVVKDLHLASGLYAYRLLDGATVIESGTLIVP